ncbi:ubiquinol-cytochrome C chaperone family protein [Sphingomonas sp.]|uniref:ubiquinol-cytochrome C chaperone family protein n=1 Tax=Sphingomonas sp. TaxID=28214 RepID=UPI001EB5D1CF|nr:ubiquinol-cytochrome C chaperone family protein [Sphingomonas sp.]MBX3594996.1 ubiquinol-cytochrome C chaperone [Sphingomonas sp.]
MGLWQRLTGRGAENPAASLYAAVVARGRSPHWYEAGEVPDTVEGRFDMIASILAIVLLRLERDAAAAPLSARLIECFVDDMDGQLRQIGIGDVVVGKHMGRMMGLVGGRLGAFRDALADDADPAAFADALARNLYRGAPPVRPARDHVEAGLRAMYAALAPVSLDRLAAGDLPE